MINEELLVTGMTKIQLITVKNSIAAYRIIKIDNDKVYYTEFEQNFKNEGSRIEGEEAYISKKSIKEIKKIKNLGVIKSKAFSDNL